MKKVLKDKNLTSFLKVDKYNKKTKYICSWNFFGTHYFGCLCAFDAHAHQKNLLATFIFKLRGEEILGDIFQAWNATWHHDKAKSKKPVPSSH
jgi:hypothetical protein